MALGETNKIVPAITRRATIGRLRDLHAERHSQLNWSGRLREPSTSPKSRVSASGLPTQSQASSEVSQYIELALEAHV